MIFSELSNIEIWIGTTALFILRYAVIAGILFYVFYVWKKRIFIKYKIQNKLPSRSQIRQEVKYSMFTFIIYGSGIWLFLYWIEKGKTRMYYEINEFGLTYFVFSIILMIVIHDAYFYWTHRLIHSPRIFKYIHKIHHNFHNPTPWAAFAFHPFEAIISIGIVPLILFLVPYHHLALVIFITFLTVFNIIIHLGFSLPKSRLFKYQNTPKDHSFHHHKSYGNYGLYFTFWDRAMGTYVKH